MFAHVTEVLCHSISGLRLSKNYICSGTYYIILGFLYYRCTNLDLTMQEHKYRGCWKHWYRYHLDRSGTNPVLVSGTDTTLIGISTILPLPKWYRYHPYLVPVPSCDSAQKWQISCHFSRNSTKINRVLI